MKQPGQIWQKFEALVRRILELQGFDVGIHDFRGDEGFDFLATRAGERWAIEVKFYRTSHAQPSLIEAAAFRVANNGPRANVDKGMLVVSCEVPDVLRAAVESRFSISIADVVDLRDWAAGSPEYLEELDGLVDVRAIPPLPDRLRKSDPFAQGKALSGQSSPAQPGLGTTLCNELAGLPRGQGQWSEYEQLCERILQYLFRNDLHGWRRQARTDDQLNRFDLVCRVRKTSEFWRFILEHLGSRYVLFEFKNHTDKIGQGEVLTTEKYLLERGLRRVGLILTRAGAEDSAKKMAQGAMREHGKLMLILDDDMLCKMLHMKERGDDPSDWLFEMADSFLLSLPR